MQNFELSREFRDMAIDRIRIYFAENMENQIGNLAGELFLDYLIENIGTIFYNQGVCDAQKYMCEKIEDLYALLK